MADYGGDVGRISRRYRADLDRREARAQAALARSYGQAFKQVEAESEALAVRIQAEMAKGNYSPSWAMRQERYQSLLNQYSEAIRSFESGALGTIPALAREGVDAAMLHTPSEVRDYAQGKAPTGITRPDFGPEFWGRVNKRAFETAMGFLGNREAPLRNLIGSLGDTTLRAVQAEWAKGLGLGYSPRKIARNVANATANIALGRAQTIARTEFHRAYRMAKSEQFQQDADTLNGWVWRANLDASTCGVCISMGGSRHKVDEPMESHPNCRCTMLPWTKTWEELGFPGVPGDRPAALDTPSGPNWLAQQSDDRIRQALGKARGDDFISRLSSEKPRDILQSMLERTSNPVWGGGLRFSPLGPGASPGAFGGAPSTGPGPSAAPAPRPASYGTLTDAEYQQVMDYCDRRATDEMSSASMSKLYRDWDDLAHDLGTTVSRLAAEAEPMMQATIDGSEFCTYRSERTLNRLLDDPEGRWKSQFDPSVTDSGGYYGPSARSRAEHHLFGYVNDPDWDPTKRPIYGYARISGQTYSSASGYGGGQANFVLDRSRLDMRTTACWNDSLGCAEIPTSVKRIRAGGYMPYGDKYTPNKNGSPYLELQYHGGLTLDDVIRIELKNAPSSALIAKLENRGWKMRGGDSKVWVRA